MADDACTSMLAPRRAELWRALARTVLPSVYTPLDRASDDMSSRVTSSSDAPRVALERDKKAGSRRLDIDKRLVGDPSDYLEPAIAICVR